MRRNFVMRLGLVQSLATQCSAVSVEACFAAAWKTQPASGALRRQLLLGMNFDQLRQAQLKTTT